MKSYFSCVIYWALQNAIAKVAQITLSLVKIENGVLGLAKRRSIEANVMKGLKPKLLQITWKRKNPMKEIIVVTHEHKYGVDVFLATSVEQMEELKEEFYQEDLNEYWDWDWHAIPETKPSHTSAAPLIP